MRLAGNLFAGIVGSVWSAVIGLAVVPLYLKFLGIESYGLIGVFAAGQAVLQLLDLGLSSAMNREVARCSTAGNLLEAKRLLHTLAVINWSTAAFIVLVVGSTGPFIAGYWLRSSNLSSETIAHAVTLMGLVIAAHWPIGLYMGALMGAQRIAVSTAVSAVMNTLGSLGAVAILAFVSPTIDAFFMWQATIGVAHAITMRWAAWRVLGPDRGIRFDTRALKRVWRFAIGVSGISVSAVALVQLDKIILSKILSLEDFGRYSLGALVASALYILLTPTFNTIYPRMSALVAANDTEKLTELYRIGTRLFLAILFPLAIAVAFWSKDLLLIWTGNADLAARVAPIASLFLIGTALNGAMHFPYALQLSYGLTRLPLLITSALLVIMVPTTVYLAMQYGAIGGAASCVVLNVLYLILGTFVTHRFLLKGVGLKWLLEDVGIPLLVSLMIVGGGRYMSISWDTSVGINILIGSILVVGSFVTIILISPRLFSALRRHLTPSTKLGLHPQ